jgi:hypothetical protein
MLAAEVMEGYGMLGALLTLKNLSLGMTAHTSQALAKKEAGRIIAEAKAKSVGLVGQEEKEKTEENPAKKQRTTKRPTMERNCWKN